jgi:hypothetical protein
VTTTTRRNQNEIIEEIMEHVRRQGGDPSESCAGTAKDSARLVELRAADGSDGLIYREAYTTIGTARKLGNGTTHRLLSGTACRRILARN